MPGNIYGYGGGYGNNQGYSFMQPQQILQVAGAASIKSLRMAPNSSLLAMDTTAPLVWQCVSDGTGMVTATAWDISLHKDPPTPEQIAAEQRLSNIENSIMQLQQMFESFRGMNNEQSNDANVESTATQSRKVVYANGTGVQ